MHADFLEQTLIYTRGLGRVNSNWMDRMWLFIVGVWVVVGGVGICRSVGSCGVGKHPPISKRRKPNRRVQFVPLSILEIVKLVTEYLLGKYTIINCSSSLYNKLVGYTCSSEKQ